MNEGVFECMYEWVNKLMIVCMNELMFEWMCINEWINEWMNEWMN